MTMRPEPGPGRRDRMIALLLWRGTWFASGLIALGLALAAIGSAHPATGLSPPGHDLMKAGVAAFIVLPVARVMLMLASFLRERDYVYAAISALVVAIIVAGLLLEL